MSAPNHRRDLCFYSEEFNIVNMSKLKTLRESVNWEIEEERSQVLDQIYTLMDDWRLFPNLREIFRAREINWLLAEDLRKKKQSAKFVEVLLCRDYRDEPDLDEATGRPLLQDTTPVHVANRLGLSTQLYCFICRMYSGRSNYVDEHGWSHFHVSCRWSFFSDRIQEFLDLGQDPNERLPATGDTSLHLSMMTFDGSDFSEGTVRILLRAGADPKLANNEGLTPLHFVCRTKKFTTDNCARKFLELCDELNRPVQVDVRDNEGWTPLRYAVASLLPYTVDFLLSRGANVSGFVFPTEFYHGVNHLPEPPVCVFKVLYRAAGVLTTVERLEKAGYELQRDDAMVVMKFFHDYGLFDRSEDNERSWYSDENWIEEAKKIAVRDDNDPSPSLYDLTRLSPKEAAKQLAYKDYFDLAVTPRLVHGTLEYGTLGTCSVRLAEKMSRGFFESWALEPFMLLIHTKLPILCCEMVLENLRNADLYNICLSANS